MFSYGGEEGRMKTNIQEILWKYGGKVWRTNAERPGEVYINSTKLFFFVFFCKNEYTKQSIASLR